MPGRRPGTCAVRHRRPSCSTRSARGSRTAAPGHSGVRRRRSQRCERRGVLPYAIGEAFGHIDRFVGIMFGKRTDELDKDEVVHKDEQFARLCRVISLTERRGYKQVEILLGNSHVLSDKQLTKIFKIIEQDEPSHWAPYDGWLDANGQRNAGWWERKVDGFIHSELLFLKLPFLFLHPRLKRRAKFADEADGRGQPIPPAPMVAIH